MISLTCFKAYDIRGELGVELNEKIAYRIGRAFGVWLENINATKKTLTVIVGSDVRLTSDSLKVQLSKGLMDSGINVIDIGMSGTEEVYFATHFSKADGGVEVTASHNPINYNGMKLVQYGSKPISGDSGLNEIKKLASENSFKCARFKGSISNRSWLSEYINHLISYIDPSKIRPLTVVVNAGNGSAGHVVDALEASFRNLLIPIIFKKINNEPNGEFPNGIPNPLLPENREDTRKAVLDNNADLGIAWDGDFDRCFLFDEKGDFIEGYYIVGLLAESFLQKTPGSKIIHDPRLVWNTIDVTNKNSGHSIQCKTGHAFIKERMRSEDAIYGGEMSAHHYFRDFSYCDSGMIPWLLVTELMCIKKQPLSSLVKSQIAAFPSSGEINFTLENPQESIKSIKEFYGPLSIKTDETDGISYEFENWRFNLRMSNTEPVVRLNIESRGDYELVLLKLKEIELRLTRQF